MNIKPVSDDAASPEVKRMFEALAATGNLKPFQRTLAHKPAILRAYNQLSGAVWAEDSNPLTEAERPRLPSCVDHQRL